MPVGQHWYHLGQSPCCLLLYSLGQPHILFISWVYGLWPLLPRNSLSTVIWVWPCPILDLTCTMVQRCPCPGSPCQVLACGCAFFFPFFFLENLQGLLHCRQILYQLSYEGSPKSRIWICKGVPLPSLPDANHQKQFQTLISPETAPADSTLRILLTLIFY